MKLWVLPLSQEVFSAYDDIIEMQKRDFFRINNGLVECYHDLVPVGILEQSRTFIGVNRVQPANLPLAIHESERHPLGTQTFTPMKGEVLVMVVALGDDKPNPPVLRTFIVNDEQGVNYHRNAWHHPFFAWQRVVDFLIVDHGDSDNCDVESIPKQELCFT